MNTLRLLAFGRKISTEPWYINKSHAVNRLYYVNSGTAVIHLATKEYTLSANKFYIIPQCANFKPAVAESFDHTFFDYYSSDILAPNQIYEFDSAFCGGSYFFKLINTLLPMNKKESLIGGAEKLLAGFLSVLEASGAEFLYVNNDAIKFAVEIIHKKYANITCKSLAEEIHLNESYFIRLFNKTLGLSPMKYIRACRILEGKELIRNGLSAKAASEKCGYSSVTAFYRAIKADKLC